MNRLLLLALFFLFSLTASAQVTFEPGFFLDNEGRRTDCLIRNTDKSTNPVQFEYRLTEDSEAMIATLDNVQEYEILGTVHKYRRARISIDKSSDNLEELSLSREPEYKEEQVFLRVLVNGKASLYSYSSHGLPERFFYSTGEGATLEPLVYKKYLVNGSEIKENSTYRQQLWSSLKCPSFTMEQFKSMNYEEKELTRLFVKYNECVEAAYTVYTEKKEKGELGFTAKVGVNSASLRIDQKEQNYAKGFDHYINTFDQKFSPVVSFEVEYIFSLNKKKWAAYFEPTFQYYKTEGEFLYYYSTRSGSPSNIPSETAVSEGTLSVNYSNITLPIGLRYYMFLNEESKFFINGAVAFNFVVNSSDAVFEPEGFLVEPDIIHDNSSWVPSFQMGIGYRYKNRYSLGANYDVSKVMFENNGWKTSFSNSVSVTLGYRLLKR